MSSITGREPGKIYTAEAKIYVWVAIPSSTRSSGLVPQPRYQRKNPSRIAPIIKDVAWPCDHPANLGKHQEANFARIRRRSERLSICPGCVGLPSAFFYAAFLPSTCRTRRFVNIACDVFILGVASGVAKYHEKYLETGVDSQSSRLGAGPRSPSRGRESSKK